MDNFVHIIEEIVDFFNLKSFVGFGVGAGANIMLRYALKHQDNVDALILINCVINSAGWHEWIYQKSNILLLRHFGMSEATIDYFNWWHFGSPHHKRNPHEVTRYQEYLRKEAHPKSLAAFLESYMNRTPIEIITKHENENHAFRIPVLHMVGSHSAFMHEAIRINKLLEQQNTIELMEFTDCGGNFLIEKANKVFEAILLFLQGAGFFAWLNVHDVVKRVQEEENEMILRNEETKDSASNDKPLEKEDVFAD
uniref:Protein NDRG3 n=1 Tax=Acrobeloides nanus TaxID=290746 RepID=A0A914CBB5_9BILA